MKKMDRVALSGMRHVQYVDRDGVRCRTEVDDAGRNSYYKSGKCSQIS